ncbi:MAG: MarR family winged helix-turn-helix transcriptional regulator [Acidobacteriota bacterium]
MRIKKASRVLTRRYDHALKPTGATGAQFTVLVHLHEGAGRSVSFLAQVLRMERTTLTRNLQVLEAKGWIRMGEEGFRRQREIELSAEGSRVLRSGLPLWQGVQKQLRQELGEDWEHALGVLDHLARLD